MKRYFLPLALATFFASAQKGGTLANQLDSAQCAGSLSRTVDDSLGMVSFLTSGKDEFLEKSMTKVATAYYLSLNLKNTTPIYLDRKVIVLFTNGKRWEKVTEIYNSKEDDKGFYNHVYMRLTRDEVAIFSANTIKKYWLYTKSKKMPIPKAQQFQREVQCIRVAK